MVVFFLSLYIQNKMIKLKLPNADLAARPDIRKWMEKVERVLNEMLPEEKLKKLQEDIHYYVITGKPYTVDSEGNVKGFYEK